MIILLDLKLELFVFSFFFYQINLDFLTKIITGYIYNE